MDELDSTDWIERHDQQLWAARIRQLRHELRAERESAAQTQSQPKPVEPDSSPSQPSLIGRRVLKK